MSAAFGSGGLRTKAAARFSSLPRDCAQPARVVENSGLNGLQYKKALRVGSKSRSLRNSA
jgi:hypothetical protein